MVFLSIYTFMLTGWFASRYPNYDYPCEVLHLWEDRGQQMGSLPWPTSSRVYWGWCTWCPRPEEILLSKDAPFSCGSYWEIVKLCSTGEITRRSMWTVEPWLDRICVKCDKVLTVERTNYFCGHQWCFPLLFSNKTVNTFSHIFYQSCR